METRPIPGGASAVETTRITAIVKAVDAAARKVTLEGPGGKQVVVKCGPEVRNFSRIQVNDRVNVTVTEELALFVGRGKPTKASAAGGAALAPLGAKPGIVVADTVEVVAEITFVDVAARKVACKFPDGSTKTFHVGPKVELTGLKAGDSVTAQYAESVAVTVEKP